MKSSFIAALVLVATSAYATPKGAPATPKKEMSWAEARSAQSKAYAKAHPISEHWTHQTPVSPMLALARMNPFFAVTEKVMTAQADAAAKSPAGQLFGKLAVRSMNGSLAVATGAAPLGYPIPGRLGE